MAMETYLAFMAVNKITGSWWGSGWESFAVQELSG